jgi:hypothetical protein
MTGNNMERRHISDNHAVGADHGAAPDPNAGENDAPRSQPGVLLDYNGAL